MTTTNLTDIFGPPISVYTRAQAIDDGLLVDVSDSDCYRDSSFRIPVALTRPLWDTIEAIPTSGHGRWGDWQGRLWDVLWMASLAAKRGGSSTDFVVILPSRGTRKRNRTLRMVCGPDDDGSPCITIGFPEDF